MTYSTPYYSPRLARALDAQVHNLTIEVQEAFQDACADNPDVPEDSIYPDIARAVVAQSDVSQEAKDMFLRCEGLDELFELDEDAVPDNGWTNI